MRKYENNYINIIKLRIFLPTHEMVEDESKLARKGNDLNAPSFKNKKIWNSCFRSFSSPIQRAIS